jgi:hypothetical protein
MGEFEIVAILDRSAGNDTVGEMWKETAIFPISAGIKDVLKWAAEKNRCGDVENFRGNLVITIGQTK